MKILIYSPAFYPNLGGIETLVSILAHEFVREGHEVKIVSQTPWSGRDNFPFPVMRRPGAYDFLRVMRWCDVYFQPNISLRGLWPLALAPRPWVASHNNWYTRVDGHLAWQDQLKHYLARFATGISVSRALAEHVAAPSVIIPNTYREDIFRLLPEIERERELVFVGRLVSDKGADVLLEALAQLQARGLKARLTIVGAGPEETALRQQVNKLGLEQQVEFSGAKRNEDLAKILNAHRIMVVPSRWREPFGIVALEGIACGCVVVGSEDGGLPEAIGECGPTFPNGESQALADVLAELLSSDEKFSSFRAAAEPHLARHRPAEVAKAYLKVFEDAVRDRSPRRRVINEGPEDSKGRAKTPAPKPTIIN
jgi:glycosyltransferase involved in cell wall biosynthesis